MTFANINITNSLFTSQHEIINSYVSTICIVNSTIADSTTSINMIAITNSELVIKNVIFRNLKVTRRNANIFYSAFGSDIKIDNMKILGSRIRLFTFKQSVISVKDFTVENLNSPSWVFYLYRMSNVTFENM